MRTEKKTQTDVIDRDTGEIKSQIQTITISKARGDKDFVKIFAACTDTVMEDLKVEDGRIRLLFWFIKQVQDKIAVNKEHIIIAHVKDIADALLVSENSIRRWLGVLIERGYIIRHVSEKGTMMYNMYMMNKEYIYKGILANQKGEL